MPSSPDSAEPGRPGGQLAADGDFLLTCFGPFRGRARNGSQTLLRHWRSQHQTTGITAAELPVGWARCEAFFTAALAHPLRGAIGLGEGHPDQVAIELLAHNATAGADEFGATRAHPAIEPDGPPQHRARLAFSLPPDPLFALPLVFSLDAGRFLCNYTLYRLCHAHLPRAAFIHVPPQGELTDDAYLATVYPIVAEILAQNVG